MRRRLAWLVVALLALCCLVLFIQTIRQQGELEAADRTIEALLARPPIEVRAGVLLDDPKTRQGLWEHGFYEEGWGLPALWEKEQDDG